MHTPTPEQQAIIDAAKGSVDNLLVNALAGAAKTTTLEMVCNTITDIPILSLAFNKRIADEMKKRLPTHVEARTMNSLGHGVWAQAIARKLSVDPNKTIGIARAIIKEIPKLKQDRYWDALAEVLRWVRIAKRDGYVPPSWRSIARFHMDTEAWLSRYRDAPEDFMYQFIDDILDRSISAANAGGIDFDDQIYMPVCFGGQWPKFPLVLIDEFQDLNELQHEMLSKLAVKRLIGVGDPWQSIYGFRGAKQNGMASAQERWNMRELTLSTTFRVPRLGVERAWFRVPHMRAREGAPDGRVESLATWDASAIPDGAAIVCRNNAPLFAVALKLLRQRRHVKLIGMDIGSGLVRMLKRLGPLDMSHQQMVDAIDVWAMEQLRAEKNEETITEKAECLKVLCAPLAAHWTLYEAIANAEDLFKQNGPIQMLSGHKAKGLEWDTVFHLDPWRVPSRFTREGTEEWEQEQNVRYVIETRFKNELFLIDTEGFVGTESCG